MKLEKMSKNKISLLVTQSFFWTNSICVLRYIENTDKLFQTFVANHIALIHDVSLPSQWSYVDTHSNPPDEASRGVPVGSLERWIKGPEFLKNPPDAWPQRSEELGPSIPDSDPEIKQNSTACASISSQARKRSNEVFERFSSWCRLKRVFAWILRFTTNLRRLVEHKRHNQSTDVSTIPPTQSLLSIWKN